MHVVYRFNVPMNPLKTRFRSTILVFGEWDDGYNVSSIDDNETSTRPKNLLENLFVWKLDFTRQIEDGIFRGL